MEAARHHLGGDHRLVAPAGEGLADDFLGMALAVGLGGVDQRDPELQGAMDDADGLRIVGGAPERPDMPQVPRPICDTSTDDPPR